MSSRRQYLVTGGAGFIGSHLVDRLVEAGHDVTVFDNFSSGHNHNEGASYVEADILDAFAINRVTERHGLDGVFHLAAIARTPWCMEDPFLAAQVNAQGTFNVLQAARLAKVRRVVTSSSNVVYAAHTPYRATKEMGELWVRCFQESYGLDCMSLRYSNVYGPRQSEEGPSPNVFAAFRKGLRENGYITVTGDGKQSRDFTHVSDINRGQILAMDRERRFAAPIDLCTGQNWTMNQVCKLWGAKVLYVADRPGDVKHIKQDPFPSYRELGWQAKVRLNDGIKDVM